MANNYPSEQAPEIQHDDPPATKSREDAYTFLDFLKEIRSHIHEHLTAMAPLRGVLDEESAVPVDVMEQPNGIYPRSVEETSLVLQRDLDKLDEILQTSMEKLSNSFPGVIVFCILSVYSVLGILIVSLIFAIL